MQDKKMMKLPLFVCLFLFFWMSCISAWNRQETKPAVTASIEAAVRAFEKYDLSQSHAIYHAVIASPLTSRDDRVKAHMALARDAWKFDANTAAADKHIDSALGQTDNPSPLFLQQGRIRFEAGNFAAALTSAERAAATGKGPKERGEADLLRAQACLASNIARIDQGGVIDRPQLSRARELLESILTREPGRPEPSDTLLGVAILLDDGPSALRAWKSYFLIADTNRVPTTLYRPFSRFADLAATWKGQSLTQKDKHTLVVALAESRFFDYAAMVAKKLVARAADIDAIIAYRTFLMRVREVNRAFYPRIAKGLRNYKQDYDAGIYGAATHLWKELEHGEKNAPFRPEAFFELIRQRFGAEGYLGTTVNFYGMLMGHIVQDEIRPIEQYSKASEFRYVLIDRLLSQDFTSWYGTTNVGGWGTESTMFQVRSAYLAEPFNRLAWVTDPSERAKVDEEIERAKRADLVNCAKDRYAEAGSVSIKIKLDAAIQLFDALNAKGLRQEELAFAFVSECMRLNVEASVFAHEGRHAIDQRYFKDAFDKMSHAERERRAKLSEVVFSSNPKLALTGGIIGARLDESSGHGLANKQIRMMLVDWMQSHSEELDGLDKNLPLIMQLDRLSNKQLVEIISAADPLATKP
jgi:hypothetical protein